MSDEDTAARLAVLEGKAERALDEVAALRSDLQRVLAETGCNVPANLVTDQEIRLKHRTDAQRKRDREQARRDLAVGLGVVSTAIGIIIAIGHAARTLFANWPWGGL